MTEQHLMSNVLISSSQKSYERFLIRRDSFAKPFKESLFFKIVANRESWTMSNEIECGCDLVIF